MQEDWTAPLLTWLEERFGHAFPERRVDHVRTVVTALATQEGYLSPAHYAQVLAGMPVEASETQALVRALTIKESYFFRDRASMDTLREVILPEIIALRSEARVLRIWSAGCSTGEELYSIAILLHELLHQREHWSVHLVGTDLDANAVAQARAAEYRPWSMRVVTPDECTRYFVTDPTSGALRLKAPYRRDISFQVLNLAQGFGAVPSPGRFDLIVCRNVLIYFGADGQRAVADTFRRALAPGGVWITGPSDPTPGSDWSTRVHPGLLVHRGPVLSGEARSTSAVSTNSEITASTRYPANSPLPPRPVPSEHQTVPPRSAPLAEERVETQTPTAAAMASVSDSQPRQLLNRATEAADNGRLAAALDLVRALIEQAPLWAEPYLLGAQIAQAQGDAASAVAQLKRALYLQPNDAATHLRLGLVLRRLGDRDAAIRALRNAMLFAPLTTEEDVGQVRSTASRLLVQMLRQELT